MTRIAVTGAAGMLGRALLEQFATTHEIHACSLSRSLLTPGVRWSHFDLRDSVALGNWIDSSAPDALIHCAADTNVDNCEQDPDSARELHVTATRRIVESLEGTSCKLVYVSTDSVFDGSKTSAYVETDVPNPLNIYAQTKLFGENEALRRSSTIVLRTNIFGTTLGPRPSFAEWVLNVLRSGAAQRMFTDVVFTPIHVSQFSTLVANLLGSKTTGLFHAGGADAISKFDFAVAVAKEFGLPYQNLQPSLVESASLRARRPKNMALRNTKIENATSWEAPHLTTGIPLFRKQLGRAEMVEP